MSPRVGETELRRRAIAGVRDEVEAFGSGHPDSRLLRPAGLLASVAPAEPPAPRGAHAGGEPVCCVGTIAVGDDCCVTGVATPPEHRRRGIADFGFIEMWELRR